MKPIRVFYSSLSGRFYASRAYKEVKPGIIEVTGQKFDVTNDIAELIARYQVTFAEAEPAQRDDQREGGVK